MNFRRISPGSARSPSRLFIFYDKREQPVSNSYEAIGIFDAAQGDPPQLPAGGRLADHRIEIEGKIVDRRHDAADGGARDQGGKE